MDCVSTRQAPRLGKKSPINKPFYTPEPQILSEILDRLAKMEQRMLLQRYEIHVLEAELEVLRSQPGVLG